MSSAGQAPPSYPAELGDGSSATAVGFAAERLTLIVDRAYPPGRPLSPVLTLPGATVPLQGKTISSKRREDARFDVHLKLTSLRREQREALSHAFAAPTPRP